MAENGDQVRLLESGFQTPCSNFLGDFREPFPLEAWEGNPSAIRPLGSGCSPPCRMPLPQDPRRGKLKVDVSTQQGGAHEEGYR